MESELWPRVEESASVDHPVEDADWAGFPRGFPTVEVSGDLVELWFVACVYEHMVAGTLCSGCGSPLGRDNRISLGIHGGVTESLVVRTECNGRRGHAHLATVNEVSGDLVFGRFDRMSQRHLRKNLRRTEVVLEFRWPGGAMGSVSSKPKFNRTRAWFTGRLDASIAWGPSTSVMPCVVR